MDGNCGVPVATAAGCSAVAGRGGNGGVPVVSYNGGNWRKWSGGILVGRPARTGQRRRRRRRHGGAAGTAVEWPCCHPATTAAPGSVRPVAAAMAAMAVPAAPALRCSWVDAMDPGGDGTPAVTAGRRHGVVPVVAGPDRVRGAGGAGGSAGAGGAGGNGASNPNGGSGGDGGNSGSGAVWRGGGRGAEGRWGSTAVSRGGAGSGGCGRRSWRRRCRRNGDPPAGGVGGDGGDSGASGWASVGGSRNRRAGRCVRRRRGTGARTAVNGGTGVPAISTTWCSRRWHRGCGRDAGGQWCRRSGWPGRCRGCRGAGGLAVPADVAVCRQAMAAGGAGGAGVGGVPWCLAAAAGTQCRRTVANWGASVVSAAR